MNFEDRIKFSELINYLDEKWKAEAEALSKEAAVLRSTLVGNPLSESIYSQVLSKYSEASQLHKCRMDLLTIPEDIRNPIWAQLKAESAEVLKSGEKKV